MNKRRRPEPRGRNPGSRRARSSDDTERIVDIGARRGSPAQPDASEVHSTGTTSQTTPGSIDPNWLPIRWSEFGSGTPVVFVHGFPTSSVLWRRVIPLIDKARCLAVEMVGYGNSIPDGQDRDISPTAQADYLLRWLRHGVCLDRVVLVGHGLGAGVVQIAATDHPELCLGVVLVNSVGYDHWSSPTGTRLAAVSEAIGHLPRAALYGLLAPLFIRDHSQISTALSSLAVHVRPYRRHGGARALSRQLQLMRPPEIIPAPGRIHTSGIPARVVCGTAERSETVRCAERLAADLDTPINQIPAGRHFTPEDQPEAVAMIVNSLVAELDYGSGRDSPT